MLLDRGAAARASHAQQIWNYANEEWDSRWPFVQANVHAVCESTLHGPRKAFHLLNWINPICVPFPACIVVPSVAFGYISGRVNRRGQCLTYVSWPCQHSKSILLQPEQEAAAQRPVLHHRRRCHAPCGLRTLKGPRRIWRDPDVSSRFRR